MRVGLLLLQLFPNGEATDIVIVTLFCITVGTAVAWCCGRCAMPDEHLTSCCSGGSPRQPWSSVLAPVSRFHSSVPLSHSSPSLIVLLASVDVMQQKSINHDRGWSRAWRPLESSCSRWRSGQCRRWWGRCCGAWAPAPWRSSHTCLETTPGATCSSLSPLPRFPFVSCSCGNGLTSCLWFLCSVYTSLLICLLQLW